MKPLLKVIVDTAAVLMMWLCARSYWLVQRQPYYFKSDLQDAKSLESTVRWINTSGILGGDEVGKEFFDDAQGGDTGNIRSGANYMMMLGAYSIGAFATWKRVKLMALAASSFLIIVSFFLHWLVGLVNCAIFLLLRSGKLNPSPPSALGDVTQTTAIVARIIQSWWHVDRDGCKRFCNEVSPQFTTVFKVIDCFDRKLVP